MSDLAERFARTQGYTYGNIKGTLWGYMDRDGMEVRFLGAIDECVLPIIWADCKAKGWAWTMNSLWAAVNSHFSSEGITDPIAALCEAYCKAREAQ